MEAVAAAGHQGRETDTHGPSGRCTHLDRAQLAATDRFERLVAERGGQPFVELVAMESGELR
jgi:hypothetical protein